MNTQATERKLDVSTTELQAMYAAVLALDSVGQSTYAHVLFYTAERLREGRELLGNAKLQQELASRYVKSAR